MLNQRQGYTQDETDGYLSQLNPAADSGYEALIDVWRRDHPDAVGQYTYYSYRFKCREKGIGEQRLPH
jgi:AP endonuclease-1